MLVVDDFGRFDGRPTLLRAACYPTLVDSVSDTDVEGWLWQCVDAELILLYAVNGKNYIQLHDFGEPRAKKSKWPAPDSEGAQAACKQMQTDANKCLQMKTDENECAQTQADENKCKQTQTSAPYSYSSSNSDSSPNAQSPPPPSGERRRESFDPMGIEFPDTMQAAGFPDAWARWVAYRQEIAPRLKPKSWQAQAAAFIRYGPQAGVLAIDQSIANGWRGVFPDKCAVGRQLGFKTNDLSFDGLAKFMEGGDQ
ncbi:MAG: hypothetical protein VW362_07140 [Candidatus Nanopelagicales bacterium]